MENLENFEVENLIFFLENFENFKIFEVGRGRGRGLSKLNRLGRNSFREKNSDFALGICLLQRREWFSKVETRVQTGFTLGICPSESKFCFAGYKLGFRVILHLVYAFQNPKFSEKGFWKLKPNFVLNVC